MSSAHRGPKRDRLCPPALYDLRKKVQNRENVTSRGQNRVRGHGLVQVKVWMGGWGYGEGMCKVGAKGVKCGRQKTKRSEDHKTEKSSDKKKEQKRAASKKSPFFWSDGDTLTRTSDPFHWEPRLDLWTRCSAGFALYDKYGV